MPPLPATSLYSLELLDTLLQKKQAEFAVTFPEKPVTQQINNPQPTPEPERDEIFAKLETAASSLSQLSEKELLYLEQQVSDLLGFEVTSSLDDQRLTHTFGKIQALAEFVLQPHQNTVSTPAVRGANMQATRPTLGWAKKPPENGEKHFLLANHLLLLEDWHLKYAHYKNWYKWRKLLVLNPFNRVAVIVELASFTLPNPMQYQFGGSPDVIRASQAWSPEAQGHVCVFFIPEEIAIKPGLHKI
ncbi:MAG: hypothetical protein O2840_01105 [bacterium]|nr:hypothetical protein [bacterium]